MILAADEPLRAEEATPVWRGASQDQIAYFIDKDVPDRCRLPDEITSRWIDPARRSCRHKTLE